MRGDGREPVGMALAIKGFFLSVLIGFALSVGMNVGIAWIWPVSGGVEAARPDWTASLASSSLMACIFANVGGLWFERQSRVMVAAKFFGFFAALVVLNGVAFAIVKSEAASPYLYVMLGLLMLISMALAMTHHAIDRFAKNAQLPFRARVGDAVVAYLDTSGPIVYMFVNLVCMMLFWLAGLTQTVLLSLVLTVFASVVLYCAFVFDARKEAALEGDRQFTRSAQPSEAFSKMLDVSVAMLPGALFMASLAWLSFSFWDFELPSPAAPVDAQALLLEMIKAMGISAFVMTVGILGAPLFFGAFISVVVHARGADFAEVERRAKKFQEVMFGGAMGRLFHATLKDRDRG